MDGIMVNQNLVQENAYEAARNSVINAQRKVYAAVNNSMVQAYWEIGEQIYKACGENDRAEYGKNLLQYLSSKLTDEFGKGFSVQNLRSISNSLNTVERIRMVALFTFNKD